MSAQDRFKAAHDFLNRGEDEKALAECLAGLALDPDDSGAHLLKATLEERLGLYSDVAASLKRGLKLASDPAAAAVRAAGVWETMGEYDRADACLRAAAKGRSVPAETRLRAAREALWHGRWDEAKRLADAGLKSEPDSVEGLRARGAAHAAKKRWAAALADLDRCLALAPDDVEALMWRGEVFRRKGDAARARTDLKRAIELWHYPLGALLNLSILDGAGGITNSQLQYVQSRVPKEVADLSKSFTPASLERVLTAMKGNRSLTTTYLFKNGGKTELVDNIHYFPRERLVQYQSNLRFGDPVRVLEHFDRLVKKSPQEAYLYSHRGEIHLWLGNYDRARADFARALKLNDYLLWPKIGLTAVAMMTDDLKEARTRLAFAETHGGSESILLPWRVEFARRNGEHKKLLEVASRMAEPLPFRPHVWLNVALAKGALGDAAGRDAIRRELMEKVPGLMADAGGDLEKALESMRGNRSRWMYTYFHEGRLKLARLRVDQATAPAQFQGNRWHFL